MNRHRAWIVTSYLVATVVGCGRPPVHPARDASSRTDSLALTADRPPSVTLPPAPPPLTVLRIAPERSDAHVPPPQAPPEAPPESNAPVDRLPIDDRLRPPVLREPLRAPIARLARGWVELDVRVDERGEVTDVRLASADADRAGVQAALAAARTLRYFPARKAGEPVAVWCRQRFGSDR
jgi:protein TonB